MNIRVKDLTPKHYSLTIKNDVATICEPLRRFGVTYFSHARVFHDKTVYALTNNVDSYYNHFKKQYPMDRPIPRKLFGEKFHYLPFLDSDDICYNQLREYREMYNADNPIYFVENYESYTDLFIYASMPGNNDVVNFYLNNIDILEKFKFYFKDKANKLIEKSNKNKILVANHMWSNFGRDENQQLSNINKQQLNDQLTSKHYALHVNHQEILITKRELDVLRSLSCGGTLKEAARAIGLSYRTVESYLDNIRYKLGIHKRSEIIKVLRESNLV